MLFLVAVCAALEPFRVEFSTTVATGGGRFVVEVTPSAAPLGAARFRELVEVGFFDGAGFFRVVPRFVVQFGLAADPVLTAAWRDKKIPDDPLPSTTGASNTKGTLAFASSGPNTRTTQLFVSLADNQFLDRMGFQPFGRVISGMDVVEAITAQYGEQPSQAQITLRGAAYLRQEFPLLDAIVSARIL